MFFCPLSFCRGQIISHPKEQNWRVQYHDDVSSSYFVFHLFFKVWPQVNMTLVNNLAITAVQPDKKLVVVEIFWVEFKWSVLILTVRPT